MNIVVMNIAAKVIDEIEAQAKPTRWKSLTLLEVEEGTMTMNGRHSKLNTRESLKVRVTDIRRFLSGRLDDIRRIRADRAAALTGYSHARKKATEDREQQRASIRLTLAAQRKKIAELEIVKADLAASEAELGMLLTSLYAAISEADKRINEIEEGARPLRRYWRDKLHAFTGGITRRKRTELSKLQRRLAEKEDRARRRQGGPTRASEIVMGALPRGIGTPKPEVESASG